MHCTIELYANHSWQPVAVLKLMADPQAGHRTATLLGYEFNYVIDHQDERDSHALSAILPVRFDAYSHAGWPAFLVDLLPQGYGRQILEAQMELSNGPAADWPLLLAGAGNPVGNLRIQEAYADLQVRSRVSPPGAFTRNDILQRADQFMEYLSGNGLYVAGSSGVQGEWPKALISEDRQGGWHLDHLLPDEEAGMHWLVKFGRSGKAVYADILAAEAAYHGIAEGLGIRTHGRVIHESGVLFIPRFDRAVENGQVIRHAQESLYALCGVVGFGQPLTHNRAIAAIAANCTHPAVEVLEYVKRDVLNVAFGNKDNHGRNTAIQRLESGEIRLSPLFDFAPMLLHPDGIARATRWARGDGGMPDWIMVAEQVAETGILTENEIRCCFGRWRAELDDRLPRLLEQYPLPAGVRERVLPLLDEVKQGLARAEV